MKRLLMITITIISLLIICSISYAQSIDVPDNIRVGLYYNSSAKSSITLSSPGGLQIGTMNDGYFEFLDEVPSNKNIVVSKGSNSYSVKVEGYGEIGNKESYPYFKSIEKNGESIVEIEGKKYRGNIEIRRFAESDMTVINHLSMQEYLYGVVPREIGGNTAIEAVKAQAIVARTYAAKNYGRRSKLGFDVMPTVDDQAYGGYEWENKNSNRAVDETDGQVVVYDGELIGGYYFSTSGGYTENSENVWSGAYDYLKAVPDTYEPEIQGNTTWEVTKSASEIKSLLAKAGINVGTVLDLVPVEYTDAGRILKLKIVGVDGEKIISKSQVRTALGLKSQWYSINDEAPTVKGTKASTEVEELETIAEESEENTPKIKEEQETQNTQWWLNNDSKDDEEVNYKVTNYGGDISKYIINDDELIEKEKESGEEYIIIAPTIIKTDYSNKPLLKNLISILTLKPLEAVVNELKPQTYYKKTEYKAIDSKATFTFRGRGWGHAVGMSQNGAKGMAENGFSAEEIIKWYYSGVEITK